MNTPPIDWLLKSDPWTEYRTRLDLLREPAEAPEALSARERMINHPKVRTILESLVCWPGPILNSHKSAGQFFHLLPFIADLGITHVDEPLPQVIGKVLDLASEEGPFGVIMNIPVHFGGTGIDSPAWALCDAPRTVYALAKLGLHDHAQVIQARDYLTGLGRDNGYPCAVSKELGKFRGPGRKDDPCPYATLIMLELMSLYDDLKNSDLANKSVDSLLDIWENSFTRHPYLFFMGTDFRKLKAPLIWFDILHVADTLSNFSFANQDKRFIQMLDVIESKATAEGKYIPESVWKAWSDWEFGQKKEASPWLTLLVWRIWNRVKR
ncbi:MAG: hypothetical protein D4R64_11825 [Porphyromonadaceae bacterium]|nr:MAG: hypothetical protein D4R64_11825 [Porphyromonadaceae bacterium]